MVQLLVMRFQVGPWKEIERPGVRGIIYVDVEVTQNADGSSAGEEDSEQAAKILVKKM